MKNEKIEIHTSNDIVFVTLFIVCVAIPLFFSFSKQISNAEAIVSIVIVNIIFMYSGLMVLKSIRLSDDALILIYMFRSQKILRTTIISIEYDGPLYNGTKLVDIVKVVTDKNEEYTIQKKYLSDSNLMKLKKMVL